MDYKNLRINGKRLQNSLEEMAKIGATPGGGVQRLTLTDEDIRREKERARKEAELEAEEEEDEIG